MNNREHLGSRLGFILLSAGCAIGVGNVWKFPWMTGQYGGGGFVLVYIICLLVLGLPVMTMEFSLGRASQASPLYMLSKLEKKGQKWHLWGPFCLLGNIALMAFYTVVCGWIIYYFVSFARGSADTLSFIPMVTNPVICVKYLGVTVVVAFTILAFEIKGGLERITKYMMVLLLVLMFVLAGHSMTLEGASEGLKFYLVPDFSKINGQVIVKAMNQAFFSLSIGMGSMAIFGSYIDKERSLLGESVNVIFLDTLVAIVAGLIIFPACFTYGIEPDAGASLLFTTMTKVFLNMSGGRVWGTAFFLFMSFAALSTVLAVCENIIAMVREMTGWSRVKGAVICGIGVFLLALTTAFGNSLISFHPFTESTDFSDFWDFIVSTNILPLGSCIFALFCCHKIGWGWDNFVNEANAGKGMKVKSWMAPIFKYVVPVLIIFIYVYGMITFNYG